MVSSDNMTAQKLLKSIRQFQRAVWQQRTFEGYKSSEIRVLYCIRHAGSLAEQGMKVSDISKRLQVTSPTITQLINSLEGNGLVERTIDPSDRRAVRITLTKQGSELIERAADTFLASINSLITALGEDESNRLADLLTQAYEHFNETQASQERSHWSGDDEA